MEVTGIIHCHSRYSYDAKLTLKELRDLCVSQGIQFVCMTEHTDEMTKESAEAFVRECDALSDGTFRFIPGFEVPYHSVRTRTHAHVLMIGARSFHTRYAQNSDALLPWVEASQLVLLAHPVRNRFKVDDELLALMDGLEVWNQQYEGKRVPRPRSLSLFQTLKESKSSLVATGGVDLHRTEHLGAPYITLSVDELSERSILNKVRVGEFSVSSERISFLGTLPNATLVVRAHRFESFLSVSIINLGKWVNKTLATFGLSFPRSFKEVIRRWL